MSIKCMSLCRKFLDREEKRIVLSSLGVKDLWCYESLIHERHERHVACVVKLFDDLLLCPQTEPCWETCEASDIFRMRI